MRARCRGGRAWNLGQETGLAGDCGNSDTLGRLVWCSVAGCLGAWLSRQTWWQLSALSANRQQAFVQLKLLSCGFELAALSPFLSSLSSLSGVLPFIPQNLTLFPSPSWSISVSDPLYYFYTLCQHPFLQVLATTDWLFCFMLEGGAQHGLTSNGICWVVVGMNEWMMNEWQNRRWSQIFHCFTV